MSGIDKQLKDALKGLGKMEATVFSATVTKVNEADKTIEIEDVDGLDYYDVRLAAAEDEKKSVLIIPKVGSSVLVTMIGSDLNTLFVSKVNEVEKIVGQIDKVNFKVDASGYQIKRENESLKTVLNDMIVELNKIIVVNGTTINVAAMNIIKQRLNTILIE